MAALAACGFSATPGPPPSPTPSPILPSVPSQQPASPESPSDNQWSTYRNEEFNYRIDVAPNWEVDDSAKNEVIIFIGRSDGLAGLHVLALDWSGTRQAFAQRNYDFHRRRAKVLFETGSRAEVRLASGLPAERFEFRVQNDTRFCTERLVDILVLAGGRGYVLQGSVCEEAEPAYGGAIKAMQRSFNLESSRVAAPDQQLEPDCGGSQNTKTWLSPGLQRLVRRASLLWDDGGRCGLAATLGSTGRRQARPTLKLPGS